MEWEELKESLISSKYHYFHTKNGVLLQGDSEEILSNFPEEVIDLVVTSPPYNVGVKYDVYNDKQPHDKYLSWLKRIGELLHKTFKETGRLAINHYLSCGNAKFRFAPLMDINYLYTKIGFKHHGVAIWWDITLTKRTAWGSWLSATAPYINSPFEGILIMYKDKWKREKPKKEEKIDKKLFMEVTSGVWRIQPEKKRKEHPAPYPEKLVEYVLTILSFTDDIVLDPFVGSGTTAVVAEKMGRKWIGIDLSKKYLEIAKNRIVNESNILKFRSKK